MNEGKKAAEWKNWKSRNKWPPLALDEIVEVVFSSRKRAIGTVGQISRVLPIGQEIGWKTIGDKFDIISYRKVLASALEQDKETS